jgi:gluconolactonase
MTERVIRVLAEGVGFAEGPVITEAGEVVCTSIDRGLLYHLDSQANVSVLAEVGGGPNGLCDLGGEFFVAQNGGNWMVGKEMGGDPPPPADAGVQRVTAAGSVANISTSPLAPNDICPGPDGLLYVTDPTRRRTYDDGRIWRVDPSTGDSEMLYDLDWFPNGIGFGPDPDVLYVASTGAQTIMRLPREPGSGPTKADVFAELPFGFPDGFTFDIDGNLIVCAISKTDDPSELQVWDPSGHLVDRFSPGSGKKYTNAALSGDGTLVISDSHGGMLLGVDWPTGGLALYPRRQTHDAAPDIAPGLRVAHAEAGSPSEAK